MRKLNFKENTIKDLGTLNRGQSMLLNLYIKGYTHAQLNIYLCSIELIVYAPNKDYLNVAEIIIRNQCADGDTIEYHGPEEYEGNFATLHWKGHLIETEKE